MLFLPIGYSSTSRDAYRSPPLYFSKVSCTKAKHCTCSTVLKYNFSLCKTAFRYSFHLYTQYGWSTLHLEISAYFVKKVYCFTVFRFFLPAELLFWILCKLLLDHIFSIVIDRAANNNVKVWNVVTKPLLKSAPERGMTSLSVVFAHVTFQPPGGS